MRHWNLRFCQIVCAGLLSLSMLSGRAQAEETEPASDDYYELMRVFVDTFEEIDRNYVKEVDRRELVEAAVRGMLAKLDPYSDYIGPEDLDHFTEAISQEFGGVGIRVEFDEKDRSIVVTSPLPGSPAYDAGIHAGDRIVEIDGKLVKEFPLEKEIQTAVEMLRGAAGEKVEIGVVHVDSKDVDKITLTRQKIQLPTVLGVSCDKSGTWDLMLDPEKKIGYIRLTHFTDRSSKEVEEALKSLKKQGMRGLILDLRFNPGGLLDSAVEIADLFVEEGLIVSTRGRNTLDRNWPARSYGTFTGFPVAVLVNHFSASASEILSACLQDHHRAIVVGERSFGKGSVQNVIKMEDGKSVLKLTTASYHRPSGKNIHRFPGAKEEDEWGVMPNDGYKVEFSMQENRAYQEDRQRRDLPGRTDIKSTFDDRQLDAARKYIDDQLDQPAAEDKETPADSQPAPEAGKDKKAAARFPLFMAPRQNVG